MQEKENKFSLIKERIIYFVESQSIKKKDFFENIGITSANFRGNAINTPLNSNSIENIITLYPQINLNWLITGKGEMIKEPINYELKTVENLMQEPIENEQSYIKRIENLERMIKMVEEERDFLRELLKPPPVEKNKIA